MRAILPALLLLAACGPSSTPPAAAGSGTGSTTAGLPKVKVISNGPAFTAADYLVPGHVTMLYFYADW